MSAGVLRGAPASPGVAVGPARVLDRADEGPVARTRPWPVELAHARAALDAARAALETTAGRLRGAGRGAEADMLEAGALMAADPALDEAVAEAVRERARSAATAIREAAELHAGRIAALGDPVLAERAADVRSLGRRAARLAAGDAGEEPAARTPGVVVVAGDLGPADVAELEDRIAAIALAAGGPTAHAAIIARSLGVPMAVGLGDALLGVADGDELLVDGVAGLAIVRPPAERAARARAAMGARRAAARLAAARRELPATTRDGRALRVLVNAAGPAEVRAGLAAGAEGIGLLRTELAFLDARGWPSEVDHRAALGPVLDALGPRAQATIRLLDFGGDKTPPFLRGTDARGIALLLGAPDALRAQLRAIAGLADSARVRVLLPMVQSSDQVEEVRAELRAAVEQAGGAGAPPALAAMVETPAAVGAAAALAACCDTLSLGTNDLTAAALGTDRFAPGEARAHDPVVLRLVAQVVAAAQAAAIDVEVCGEAASDPTALPLLVGLGVDELSVGAARVGEVRGWVRALDAGHAAAAAAAALALHDAHAVAALVRGDPRLSVAQGADAADEAVDGTGRLGALGAQP
jgi:phosphoenolpyruvate-protein kinase (PTS system EI component)